MVHLARFAFGMSASTKITQRVRFPKALSLAGVVAGRVRAPPEPIDADEEAMRGTAERAPGAGAWPRPVNRTFVARRWEPVKRLEGEDEDLRLAIARSLEPRKEISVGGVRALSESMCVYAAAGSVVRQAWMRMRT